jgi:hypothetical protein
LKENPEGFKETYVEPGEVVHACDPSPQEVKGDSRRIPSSRPAWAT